MVKFIVDLRGKGSVYRKIIWARPISNFSISLPVGTLKLEIYPTQKIFRYTDPFLLRSIQYWTSYFSQPKNRMDYSFITLCYHSLYYMSFNVPWDVHFVETYECRQSEWLWYQEMYSAGPKAPSEQALLYLKDKKKSNFIKK